ncbi:carbonic anhydrase 2-like [Acanthaster planci]|uniref:Carbonic anhydrase n=1 Tax=Acanthaster planci TaxID=133434 RepID=A0A8B7Y0F2_ACAPL|nr:carbonic anhydrase 2-like [Acanthaster planci]
MEDKRTSCTYLCILLASVLFDSEAASWGYLDDEKGPNNWTAIYGECGGIKQSPIDIVTASAEANDLGDFTLVGFEADDVPVNAAMIVSNNGHVVEVAMTGDYLVSGAGLGPTAYKAVQFHFHWGSVNSRGSEHTVDGKAYAAELHIVCYNTKYEDFFTALNSSDGLTVLGFFLDVHGEDNPALASLFDAISSMIQFKDEMVPFSSPIVFKSFLPSDLSTFYRYIGSLTSPPCYEIVTWNVFASPIMVSEAQLMALRGQYANKPDASVNITLRDTFRPVQSVSNRTVYVNTKVSASTETMNPTSSVPGLVATMNATSSAPGLFATMNPTSSAPGLFAFWLVAMVIAKVMVSAME